MHYIPKFQGLREIVYGSQVIIDHNSFIGSNSVIFIFWSNDLWMYGHVLYEKSVFESLGLARLDFEKYNQAKVFLGNLIG